jgi:hypothetical protein
MELWVTVQEIRYVGESSCAVCLAPLMEALLCLEDADASVRDPDVTADIGSGDVEVRLEIEAADPVTAMSKAVAALHAAIGSGGATPDWATAAAVIHVAPAEAADSLLVA